ncbi:hypothetical protein BJ322DRAFT_1109795 [Thelephora terrestris]|uniref:F-box domain-containing protein n=1 Tax=Thelephora terrestris TaxID=56493 RepID=A0A9P6L5A4_9AGAM|nr:hypothetical protein BJ322DRAFT_1109795 [Thelephora terrestris]
MDAHTYPGRGLSLSQLIFALNKELKRVVHSPMYTLEAVSQLDRDASIALATIREWRNSFAHVNRIPTDILSLIPTHLPTQKGRFHAASVCRHWRGVLLEYGALWSQLFLNKGEECVSTLLKRAKGSALDVILYYEVPVDTFALISPRAQRIRHLELKWSHWKDIIAFSDLNCGNLPLLRTLEITSSETYTSHGGLNVVVAPSLPFFRGSINLESFTFHSWRVSFLSHFIFPNLTTFELLSRPAEECSALCLLNFLEASPTLQTVDMTISTGLVLSSVPQEMVVALPNVETFSLHIPGCPATKDYDIAAHISCPCAKHTSLSHDVYESYTNDELEAFPTPDLLDTIIHRYTECPIEEVELKIKRSEDKDTDCSLTFRSSNATVVELSFRVTNTGLDEAELNIPRTEMGWRFFSQALTTIQCRPLLSHVKRLHIEHRAAVTNTYEMLRIAEKVPALFDSLGPLDKLRIRGCDLHTFFDAFLDRPMLANSKPVVFPQVKKLVVLHPFMEIDETECTKAIVGLAKLQHSLGIPFELVKVRMWDLPAGMAEELEQWVDVVDCEDEEEYM